MSLKDRLDAQARRAVEGAGSIESASASALRPRALSSPGAALIFQDEVRNLKTELAAAQSLVGKPLMLDQTLLVFVPSRKRELSIEEYAALKGNIESSGILEPLRVRPLENGRFEVTSGSNRGLIGIGLGMKALPCVVVVDAEADVERNAFYANLFHAPLPDYEKWHGFAAELSKSGMTQAALAKLSGIPESSLSSLMVFGKFPDAVRKSVAQKRHLVSRVVAEAIFNSMQRGATEDQIVSILNGDKGVSVAAFKALNKPIKNNESAANRTTFKGEKGGAIEVVRVAKSIRVLFKSEQDEEWLAAVIDDALCAKYSRTS